MREILGLARYCSGLGKADRGNFVAQVVQRVERFAFVRTLPELIAVFLLQLAQLRQLLLMRIELTAHRPETRRWVCRMLGDVEL